jgi:hypothetical protein
VAEVALGIDPQTAELHPIGAASAAQPAPPSAAEVSTLP